MYRLRLPGLYGNTFCGSCYVSNRHDSMHVLAGLGFNLIATAVIFNRRKQRGYPILAHGENVVGGDVLSFKDNDMGMYSPISEADKMSQKIRCHCLPID